MAVRVALCHHTVYRFDRVVEVYPHVVRLRPAPHCRTAIQSYTLNVTPGEFFLNWQQDPFGNYLARLVFPGKRRELHVDVDLVADLSVINPFDFFLEESAQTYPFSYESRLARQLAPYLEVTENGVHLEAWLKMLDRNPKNTVDFLVGVNQQLQKDIAYSARMEPGVQPCEQTLERGVGSCRDSGWLLVQILRQRGIAARFVSGYLIQLTADAAVPDGPGGPAQDSTDLHAWAEAYIPGAGWIGLDPTSGLFAGEGHIPLACSPEPGDVAPISGSTAPCEVEFSYTNEVRRIH